MLPVLAIQGSNQLCIGDSITLNASGADSYLWSPSTALSLTTGSYVISKPLNNIQYTLVGNLNGCVDSISYPITVNPIPSIQVLSNIQSGCEPLAVSFNLSSTPQAQNVVWNFGNSTTSTSLTPNAIYPYDGVYDVTLSITDIHGCKNSIVENQFITVYPKPVVNFTSTPDPGMVNEAMTFTSSSTENPVLWSWNFGDGNSTTNTVPIENYTYQSSRNFTVTHYVETEHGCSDTVSKTVTVITRLVIPNVLTPNSDGANDYFVIDGLQFLENCVLKIYNRWGSVVYESTDYKNNWDGGALADGTYFYILTVPDFLKTGPFSGSVTLLK
jgi:gliding motility-associated-like protein